MVCGICGNTGHNRRTCPKNKPEINSQNYDDICVCVCVIPWQCGATSKGKCIPVTEEKKQEKFIEEEYNPKQTFLKFYPGYGNRPYHFPSRK